MSENRAGWSAIHFEGDSQPLGYSIFDPDAQTYTERADAPVSGPNLDEEFAGLDNRTLDFISGIVGLAGGTRFF